MKTSTCVAIALTGTILLFSGCAKKPYPSTASQKKSAEQIVSYGDANISAANELIRIMSGVYEKAESFENSSAVTEQKRSSRMAALANEISLAEYTIPMLNIPQHALDEQTKLLLSSTPFSKEDIEQINTMLFKEMNAQFLSLAVLRVTPERPCDDLRKTLSQFAAAYSAAVCKSLAPLRNDYDQFAVLREKWSKAEYMHIPLDAWGTKADYDSEPAPMVCTPLPQNQKAADADSLAAAYAFSSSARLSVFNHLPEGETLRAILRKNGMTDQESKSYERRIGKLLSLD
jgi:hypothetical protein